MLVEICRALVGTFIRQQTPVFLRKGDGVPIDRDSFSIVREDAGVFSWEPGSDVLLVVKTRLPTRVDDGEFCSSLELAISCTKQNIIPSILSVKFPRGLEQFEEFPDQSFFPRTGNDSN